MKIIINDNEWRMKMKMDERRQDNINDNEN
jgi:hypothetical protein